MIIFNPEDHSYKDENDNSYISVTKFINQFVPKFDVENKSKIYAAKYGLNVDEVKKDWSKKNKDSTDFGTKIHLLIESSLNTGVTIPGPYFNIVSQIVNDIKTTVKGTFITETIVHNKEYKVAGTSDLIIDNTDSFSIIDFKTNKQIKYTNDFEDKFLYKPVDHLPNSEYFKYSLQLSFYAYFYSQLTNKRVDRLAFFWLKRKNIKDYENLDKATWIRYNTPFLKEEVELCLQSLKEYSK